MLFNGEKYDIRDITYCAPQGSILSHLLFILYINDISGVSDTLFYVLFADDTNIFLVERIYIIELTTNMLNCQHCIHGCLPTN